ncbi:hypothetical protein H5071_05680 [Shewanella sp. SR41-2]|nr:hypothetical protein [Shewanella sp. SR41-2]
MFKFIRKLFKKGVEPKREESASPVSVSFDDDRIISKLDGNIIGSVEWQEIDLVAICIEDDFLPFPYWYIGYEGNLLRIPNDAVGGSDLFFEGMGKYIPEYSSDATYQKIIEASSAMDGSFIVWKSDKVKIA